MKKIYLVEVKETFTYVVPTEATSLKKAKKMVVDNYNAPFVEEESLVFAVDRADFSDMTAKVHIPSKEEIEIFITPFQTPIFKGVK